MDSVTKRILTRKSILKFGRVEIRDLSVQMIIDSRQEREIVSAYFGLSKIDFLPEILDELLVPLNMRIEKPGKVTDLKETMDLWYKHKYEVLGEKIKLGDWNRKNKDKRVSKKRNFINYEKNFTKQKMALKNHGK